MAHKGSTPADGSALTDPPVSASRGGVPTAPFAARPSAATPSLLAGLARGFRRRWRLASAAGFVTGGVVGALLWAFLPETYTAEIRLRVAVPGHEAPAGADETARTQRPQATLIQSSAVLEAVLRRPEVARLPDLRHQHDPLAWLGAHLAVEPTPIPDILQVWVAAPDADEAARLVGAVVDCYRREAAARREASLRQLKEARGREETALQQKRQRLARREDSRLGAAEKECQQARFDLRVARAELAAWEQRRGAERVTVSDQAVEARLKEDVPARKLLAELDVVEQQIRQVIRVSALRERDPSLAPLARRRDEVQQKLKTRRAELLTLVEADLRSRAAEEYQAQKARLADKVHFYQELVASLEEEVRKLGGAAGAAEELKELRQEIAAGSETLRKLAAEIERAEGEAADAAALVNVAETPVVRSQDPSRRIQLAGLGGAGTAALLALGLSWREYRLRRITCGSDVARGLGLPVVGSIPLDGKRGTTKVEDLDGRGVVSEAVDALRTVLMHDKASGPRLLLVTSAVAGEGKTSLAVRLAASLARAWRKTLLIDADLRKPEAHALFDTPLEPGLAEMLRGEAEVGDVIQPTGLSRLWLVPAGHGDDHAIQALAQDGAGRVFDRLKEQFDFVVIDACPVLPVADVLLLGARADGVLLAVRSGASRLPMVEAARARLADLDIPVRGAVLLGPDADLARAG